MEKERKFSLVRTLRYRANISKLHPRLLWEICNMAIIHIKSDQLEENFRSSNLQIYSSGKSSNIGDPRTRIFRSLHIVILSLTFILKDR